MTFQKRLSRYVLIASIAFSMSGPVHAQDILGTILRGARPNSANRGFPQNPKEVRILQLVMHLKAGEWRTRTTNTQSLFPDTVCRGQMPSDLRRLLEWGAAAKPTISRNIGPNAILVKDVSDPRDPEWRVAVAICISDGAPEVSSKMDPRALLSMHGMDGGALFSAANAIIKEVEGTFPPPPTAQDLADAKRRTKFLNEIVSYSPGGEMQVGRGDHIFDTAADCDRHVSLVISNVIRNIPGSKLLGSSVVMAGDGSGYAWFGCIRVGDLGTKAFEQYIQATMSPSRAKAMQRFPNLNDSAQPPTSQRGKSVRF